MTPITDNYSVALTFASPLVHPSARGEVDPLNGISTLRNAERMMISKASNSIRPLVSAGVC